MQGAVVIPEPAGLLANDVIIFGIGQFDHFGAPITGVPPNCTQFAQIEQANCRITGFWKRVATDSDTEETDNDYDFSWASGSTWSNGWALAFSGVKTTGDPIGSNLVTGAAAAAAYPTLTLPSVAFQPGLVWMGYHSSSSNTNDTPDNFTSGPVLNYGMSAYRIPGATGAFSSVGATVTSSMNLTQILLALEPAGGAAATSDALKRDKQMRLGALMQM